MTETLKTTPYWWEAAPRLERPAPPPASVDVAVVGGGFTGLSTALHLAEAGARVVVLEARAIGEGASGLNGGQVIPGVKRSRDELATRHGVDMADKVVALGDGAAQRV